MSEPFPTEPPSSGNAAARLAAIVDSSFDAIISKNLDSTITSWNAAAERVFGYTAEEAVGRSILLLIPEELQSEETDIIERIRSGERVESYETRRLRKDGTPIHVSITVSPIRDEDGRIVGASKIARDVSGPKESERRIRLLLREVNHRVKNQFAVILSIIRESSNRSLSPQEFEEQVRSRIMALSRSHDLLVNSDWSGASMVELVQEQLSVFGHEERISVSGPILTLQPNAVQHIGMALHELGTNAAKYGALRDGRGKVRVTWEIHDDENGQQVMEMNWLETFASGRAAGDGELPRRGFGTIVLDRVVPLSLGGKSGLERGADGLSWTLTAPLHNLMASASDRPFDDQPSAFDPI